MRLLKAKTELKRETYTLIASVKCFARLWVLLVATLTMQLKKTIGNNKDQELINDKDSNFPALSYVLFFKKKESRTYIPD